jgi:hypothetical protein
MVLEIKNWFIAAIVIQWIPDIRKIFFNGAMNTSVGCKELMMLGMVVAGREIRKRREDKEKKKSGQEIFK